tara:strand:- start:1911 stop:2072 length:162 start_codon:yes stop_codon:yes gene_type:complete
LENRLEALSLLDIVEFGGPAQGAWGAPLSFPSLHFISRREMACFAPEPAPLLP